MHLKQKDSYSGKLLIECLDDVKSWMALKLLPLFLGFILKFFYLFLSHWMVLPHPTSLSCCMSTPLPGRSGQLTSCSWMFHGHGESSEGTELLLWQLLGCGTRCHCMLERRLSLNLTLKPTFSHWALTQLESWFYFIIIYILILFLIWSYFELFCCVYTVKFNVRLNIF